MITLTNTSYISSPDADSVQEALCERLTKGAEECSEDNFGPQFRGKPVYGEGALKLWCQDEATFQWLEDTISTIRLPSGESLSLKNGVEAPQRVVCGLMIPDHCTRRMRAESAASLSGKTNGQTSTGGLSTSYKIDVDIPSWW